MDSIFFLDFYSRLKFWSELRDKLSTEPLETQVVEVDKFWQKCPMLNHYLHPADVVDWPTPWELISDNEYCIYARGLGIIYTLMLLGINDIDFVTATDYNRENVVLVLVDSAKYVLNWNPNSVLNTSLADFTVTKHINISSLKQKIGNE